MIQGELYKMQKWEYILFLFDSNDRVLAASGEWIESMRIHEYLNKVNPKFKCSQKCVKVSHQS
jgi:hypothetical protein